MFTATLSEPENGRILIMPETVADCAVVRELVERGRPVHLQEVQEKKTRSAPHHRKFFGVIAAAFVHWPEAEPFQPESEEHLRQYLEVKAGHRHYQDFPVTADNADAVADMIVRFAAAIDGKKVFPRFGDGVVRLYWARTISWAKLRQSEFNKVSKPVFDEIESVIGISVDELTREHRRAA